MFGYMNQSAFGNWNATPYGTQYNNQFPGFSYGNNAYSFGTPFNNSFYGYNTPFSYDFNNSNF